MEALDFYLKLGGAILTVALGGLVVWTAPWSPPDENLPRAAASVAGIVGAIIGSLVWAIAAPRHVLIMGWLAVALAWSILFCFLFYYFLLGYFVHYLGSTKVIGGWRWTPEAAELRRRGLPSRKIIEECSNDPDRIWTRESRETIKLLLLTVYMVLTISMIVCSSTVCAFAVTFNTNPLNRP